LMLLLRWGLVLISLILGPDLRHGRVAHGSIMFRLTLATIQTVQESTTGRGKPDRCRFVVWICLGCVSSCIRVWNGWLSGSWHFWMLTQAGMSYQVKTRCI
jgi:hypothetical protein